MLEQYIRPFYQFVFVEPVMWFLDKYTRCTPDQITYFSMLVGLFAGVAIALNWVFCGLILLVLSGYCDTLDGSYARKKSMISPHGAALDIVGDRIVEFAIILGLLLVSPTVRAMPAFFMLGSSFICVTSFLVVGIFSENQTHKSFYYSSGIIERPEAFAFFAAMLLLPNWFVGLAWLYTVLVLLTAFIRIRQFLRTHL